MGLELHRFVGFTFAFFGGSCGAPKPNFTKKRLCGGMPCSITLDKGPGMLVINVLVEIWQECNLIVLLDAVMLPCGGCTRVSWLMVPIVVSRCKTCSKTLQNGVPWWEAAISIVALTVRIRHGI